MALWRVLNKDKRKVLFEGLEEDARKFVTDNFPRLHVEPGQSHDLAGEAEPDAHLQAPETKTEDTAHWNGADWSDSQKSPAEGTVAGPVDSTVVAAPADVTPVDANQLNTTEAQGA